MAVVMVVVVIRVLMVVVVMMVVVMLSVGVDTDGTSTITEGGEQDFNGNIMPSRA